MKLFILSSIMPFSFIAIIVFVFQHIYAFRVPSILKLETLAHKRTVAANKLTATKVPSEIHTGYVSTGDIPSRVEDEWDGYREGLDWELEKARRYLDGPGFAPLRMTLWAPDYRTDKSNPPGFLDHAKILLNNALQIAGMAKSMDGAPLVQIVNKYKGSTWQLLSRIADGDLAELAGGPLFLLLGEYYKKYGPVFKLAFGPKSFIVVSDPAMVKHILKENPLKYDKGILAEILEPVMGKGLIPADPKTWKVRRKAIVPGFHKAWLNAMVSDAQA